MPFVIDTLIEYIAVGLMISVMLFFLYTLTYLFIYKKVIRGKKILSFRKAMIFSIFVAYIYLVLNTTIFANFRNTTYSGINLDFFNSYKKVLYRFTNRIVWRDITLNILMFVPFGFLLPILHSFFYRPYVTLPLSFLFTICIEITQLIIKVGAFDVDDIFNNFLGSIIGYCFAMSILSSRFNKDKNRPKHFMIYAVFLIGITLSFLGYYIFCYIH